MKLLIIDRDGVINEESDRVVKSAGDWVAIPGSIEAIARASQAGLRCVVISNQPAIGQGTLTMDELNHVHDRMLQAIVQHGGRIEAILFCPHLPADGCDCRKPGSGLIVQLAERTRVPYRDMALIGDRDTDLEAARAVGVRAILVRTGRGTATAAALDNLRDVPVFDNLAAAVDAVIAEQA
jgi:D-glycero-D-manno-heptose 1,7-bisphosphate phosphatase